MSEQVETKPSNKLNIVYLNKYKLDFDSPFYDYWNIILENGQKVQLVDMDTQKVVTIDKEYINRFGSLQ
jgi:hypothetical protein